MPAPWTSDLARIALLRSIRESPTGLRSLTACAEEFGAGAVMDALHAGDILPRTIGAARLVLLPPVGACAHCHKPLPAADVQAFRRESGTLDALPRVCSACAEAP